MTHPLFPLRGNGLYAGRTNGHTEADHLVGVVRNVFTWVKKQRNPLLRGLVNPALDIASRSKLKSRDRVLTHQEIKRLTLWPASLKQKCRAARLVWKTRLEFAQRSCPCHWAPPRARPPHVAGREAFIHNMGLPGTTG
jgi:hypothetical protein